MTELNFNLTRENDLIVKDILRRMPSIFIKTALIFDLLSFHMSLAAIHNHCCKLDFKKLLSFKDEDFIHDVYGIMHHIDRKTGQLKDCFIPRCAKQDNAL